jgi:hypothetical protein
VKRSILDRMSKSSTLEPERRARVVTMLGELDQPSTPTSALPIAAVPATTGPATAVTAPAPPTTKPVPHPTGTPTATTATPVVTAPTTPATTGAKAASALEKARAAAAAGNALEVRALLYNTARTGHASEEGRLVKAACRQLNDQACYEEMKAKYP